MTVIGAFILLLGAGTITYRHVKSKPIVSASFEAPDFTESWVYGKSDRSALATILGSPFLWVVVADETLHVSPHLPLNLFFVSEAFGWDHRLPLKTITEIHILASDRHPGFVVSRYRHATGEIETLKLRANKVHDLEQALRAAQVARGFHRRSLWDLPLLLIGAP